MRVPLRVGWSFLLVALFLSLFLYLFVFANAQQTTSPTPKADATLNAMCKGGIYVCNYPETRLSGTVQCMRGYRCESTKLKGTCVGYNDCYVTKYKAGDTWCDVYSGGKIQEGCAAPPASGGGSAPSTSGGSSAPAAPTPGTPGPIQLPSEQQDNPQAPQATPSASGNAAGGINQVANQGGGDVGETGPSRLERLNDIQARLDETPAFMDEKQKATYENLIQQRDELLNPTPSNGPTPPSTFDEEGFKDLAKSEQPTKAEPTFIERLNSGATDALAAGLGGAGLGCAIGAVGGAGIGCGPGALVGGVAGGVGGFAYGFFNPQGGAQAATPSSGYDVAASGGSEDTNIWPATPPPPPAVTAPSVAPQAPPVVAPESPAAPAPVLQQPAPPAAAAPAPVLQQQGAPQPQISPQQQQYTPQGYQPSQQVAPQQQYTPQQQQSSPQGAPGGYVQNNSGNFPGLSGLLSSNNQAPPPPGQQQGIPTSGGNPLPAPQMVSTLIQTCPPGQPCANIPLIISQPTTPAPPPSNPANKSPGSYVCIVDTTKPILTPGSNCTKIAAAPKNLSQPVLISDLLRELSQSGGVAQPLATLVARSPLVAPGGTVHLTWGSVGTVSCGVYDGDGAQIAAGGADGTITISPFQTTTTFKVRCLTVNGGTVEGRATVLAQ